MYQGQRILPQKRVGKDYVNGKIGQGDGYGEEKKGRGSGQHRQNREGKEAEAKKLAGHKDDEAVKGSQRGWRSKK